ncbi:MAG: hypothetical protein AB7E39_00780 [Endomicrobiaceae bacterium]
MAEISYYFGIKLHEIRKVCVICPVSDHTLFSCLGKSKQYSGLFARIINYDKATIISTKNNFLVGDIILQLKNTPCENVILFGSCGGVGDIKISDKIIVKKVFNFESFSEMLEMKRSPDTYYPSTMLFEEFLSKSKDNDILQVKCATTSSILLEKAYNDWFDKNKINAVDMECSLVFSAASSINRKAIALLYVTDHITSAGLFDNQMEDAQKEKLLRSRQSLSKSICDFINNV